MAIRGDWNPLPLRHHVRLGPGDLTIQRLSFAARTGFAAVVSTIGDPQGLFRFFGDINGDQIVNGVDFGLIKNAFGTQVGDTNYLSYLDLNGDGVINGFDLGQFRT